MAVSSWFIETMLAGWVLASSMCADKHAGWVQTVVSMSWNDPGCGNHWQTPSASLSFSRAK